MTPARSRLGRKAAVEGLRVPSRVVVRGAQVAIVVYLDDAWGTIAVYQVESGTWLLCREAEYRFRLDRPIDHRLTRAVVRDVCRAMQVDRCLVNEAVRRALLVGVLAEVRSA